MPRTILHVDMDAFFAAVEERENPALRGRPVVVGADPKGGRGRGVVVTANYEARRYGIGSAMPISEAYRRSPGAAYVRPHGKLYQDAARRIFAILRSCTDLVEPLSIDEAFLDVTASRRLLGDGPAIARSLKEKIRESESLTASVGVATSKFVAKLASDLEKPDGLVIVPAGKERETLAPLEVRRLWGAGPRTLARLERLGVGTIGDVAALGREALVHEFGEALGGRFHELSRGIDSRPVCPDRARKSLGKEFTFDRDVADRRQVERTLLRLCEEVGGALRREKLAGHTVTVKLRWEGFETVTRQATQAQPVDTTERIWPAARALLRAADQPARRVRLVGVTVSGFGASHGRQLSLFEEDDRTPDSRVADAVDTLAERFGRRAVTRAALMPDVNGRLGHASDPAAGRRSKP